MKKLTISEWKKKFFTKEQIIIGDMINKICAKCSFGVPTKKHPYDYKPQWTKEEEFYFNGDDDDMFNVSYYFAVRELQKKGKIKITLGGEK